MTSSLDPSREPWLDRSSSKPFGFWYIPLLAGILLASLVYGLMPFCGVEKFSNLLTLDKALAIGILISGLIGYCYYLKVIRLAPSLLFFLLVIAWPILEFGNRFLLNIVGLNLHIRPLLFLGLFIPSGVYALLHIRTLLSRVGFIKYFLLFWFWIFGYFLFNNLNTINPSLSPDDVTWLEGSLSALNFLGYSYSLTAALLAAVVMMRHAQPERLFYRFNTALIISSLVLSVITLACYPLDALTQQVDGFKRAIGIFSHPNPYAHHLGILLLYMLGLISYYQYPVTCRIKPALLWTGFVVCLIAFILAMSKTAIATFGLCTGIFCLLNLTSPTFRRVFLKSVPLITALAIGGILLFGIITGQSIPEMIQARISQTQSYSWRLAVWQILLDSIKPGTVLMGHGLTAANQLILQMTYNNESMATPLILVHNGYIEILYDLGLVGYLYFIGLVSLLVQMIRWLFFTPHRIPMRSLLVTGLTLPVYFMVVSGFDEVTTMFNAPILFWSLITLLFCYCFRQLTTNQVGCSPTRGNPATNPSKGE